MKTVFLLAFACCLGSLNAQCAGSFHKQNINKEVILEDGKQFLLGKINIKGLQSAPYNEWYHDSHDGYTVDETLIGLFKEELSNYKIKLFMGTWCGDSKREVPRFIKILEAAEFPMHQIEMVALDRRKEFYKKSPTGEEKGLHIIKVPTMIFLKDDKEVNRIVESPIESLEEDITAILKNNSYTPNYAGMTGTN